MQISDIKSDILIAEVQYANATVNYRSFRKNMGYFRHVEELRVSVN